MLQLGKETTVHARGKKYTLGRVTLAVIFGFGEWIKEQLGDPFALAERFVGRLPADEWTRLFKEAEATARELEAFTLATEVARRFMKTERGAAKLGQLMLQEHHPDVSEDEAFDVLAEIGLVELNKAVKRGTGKVPEKNADAPAA